MKNMRTGKISTGILWRNTQRYELVEGSNSHGRWNEGYRSGDWQKDDQIEIQICLLR